MTGQKTGKKGTQFVTQCVMPTYNRGDYVKVELLPGSDDEGSSVWIRVDHCDERHAIVFGTLDSDPPSQLAKTLRRGAKVAASYWTVREHQWSGS